ncbi:MAG: lysoplasmalogenase [Myxococcales bacterium]|nr:lysoplasmalogenase [Myxococcales bacterium]
MLLACTILTVVAIAGLLFAEWRNSVAGRWLTKPIAALGFVAAALAAGALESRFGLSILAGLSLSLVGDVFLISSALPSFRAGLFTFLLGHVAFAAAFVLRGVDLRWSGFSLVALTGVAWFVGRWLLPHVEAKMRGPVVAYIAVISAMVALAAGTVAAHGHPILLGAAIAFFLSDLSVARDRFVAPGFANRLWGLPLYYGAQLLFAWSLAG